jgi:hypothetical protein
MRYEQLPVEKVQLDIENPRIKHYLSMYKKIDSESLALALSGSSASDAFGKYRALRDSIKQNGGIFTPIIVNHKTDDDSYTVIEGNTRLKFYMEFKEDGVEGTWDNIPSIVYDDMDEDDIHAIRLQAHMVGARDWDAYSKAKYLDYLYNTEKKSMKFLKNFCGGQESYIRNLIDAYNDMTDYYLPICEADGDEPDTQVFSYFVELQKSQAKDAVFVHGYNLNDFTKWVINGNLDRAESVRKLAKVLGEEDARKTFLKENMTAAVRKLDLNDREIKKLSKTNLYDLAKELTRKLFNVNGREIDNLAANPKYEDKRTIIMDLKDEVDYLVEKIGGDV